VHAVRGAPDVDGPHFRQYRKRRGDGRGPIIADFIEAAVGEIEDFQVSRDAGIPDFQVLNDREIGAESCRAGVKSLTEHFHLPRSHSQILIHTKRACRYF
jgi:hypothetical protein